MTSVRAGFLAGLTKLRSKATLITILLALAVTVVLSILERRAGSQGAADRIVGSLFRIILPLTMFSLSGSAIGLRNLRDEVWALVRFGHSRFAVMIGHTTAVAAVGALVAVFLIVVSLVMTRVGVASSAGASALPADLITTSWIGALASLAYAAWFAVGATLGRLGGGRGYVLTADFFIGPAGTLGFFFPKGAVYNLIGLTAADPISQPQASVLLVVLSVVLGGLLALRAR